MKRIIIVCEGRTEQEFCSKVLAPHFAPMGIYLYCPLISKSKGGIVKWSELKKNIILLLKSSDSVIVTTFIDYYGITQKHKFPNWNKANIENDKNIRMQILENAMSEDIEEKYRNRYIPYIQLHEFEGLLFNDIKIFQQNIPSSDIVGLVELQKTFEQYSNPELINENKDTSPSNRLKRIIRGYNKLIHGIILAESIGLSKIRNKADRFNNWINKLEQI